MKLDKVGQSALLRLAEIDLEIAQIKHEITSAIESKELESLRSDLASVAGELIAARTNVENLEESQRRADDDLHLVESRIARDQERLLQTSSPKDAQGIQSEIESLSRRKSELEDTELGVLAELEEAQKALNEISERRDQINNSMNTLQAEIQTKVDDLKSRGRKLTADKEIVVGKISADVISAYELLAKRQIAVGQVVNRSCSACRMGLTASAIDALSDLAEDELGYCPECQAMIVR
jgi:predicted  nucleic acid-binding Zn-ribbon protein